jgi:hypothetical protein
MRAGGSTHMHPSEAIESTRGGPPSRMNCHSTSKRLHRSRLMTPPALEQVEPLDSTSKRLHRSSPDDPSCPRAGGAIRLDVETPPSLTPDDPSCPRAGGAIRLVAVPVSVATAGSQTSIALSYTRMHSSARTSSHTNHFAMIECNTEPLLNVSTRARPVHNCAARSIDAASSML